MLHRNKNCATLVFFLDSLFTQKPGSDGLVFLGTFQDSLGQRQRVSHHSPVQAVLRHYGTPPPAFLGFAPFRSSILEPDLRNKNHNSIVSTVTRSIHTCILGDAEAQVYTVKYICKNEEEK